MSTVGQQTSGNENRARELSLMRRLGSALVCISGRYHLLNSAGEPESEDRLFAYTAFAMSFDGVPVLVTAGHVLQDCLEPLFSAQARRRAKVSECNLCDFFGADPKVRRPTPFDYEGTPRGHLDESCDENGRGVDIGLLLLRPFWWLGMQANGVEPLHEGFWVEDPSEQFDVYKVLGFPDERTDKSRGLSQPTLISVERLPADQCETPDGRRPWFVGSLANNSGIGSPVGMSGGPVFGFRKVGPNLWDYKIVGLQSWWKPGERIVYAMPLHSIAGIIAGTIERLRARANGAS